MFTFAEPGTVTIQWVGSGKSYRLKYRKRNDLDWIELPETLETTAVITAAFEIGILYEFEFVSVDDGGRVTSPDYYGYTIPTTEPAPATATGDRVASTYANISWTGAPEKIYVIYYRPVLTPDAEYSMIETTGNEVTIDELLPEVKYEVVVSTRVNDTVVPYIETPIEV